MFCTPRKHNSHNRGFGIRLNPIRNFASRSISSKTAGELDTFGQSNHWVTKAATIDKEACPSSILSISEEGCTETDDNTSSCEPFSYSEFQDNSTLNRFDENDYGGSLVLDSMVYEELLPPVKNLKPSVDKIRFCDTYPCTEFSEERASADDLNCIWSPPLSPICELPHSLNNRVFSDNQNVFSNPVSYKGVTVKESDQTSQNGLEKVNLTFDNLENGFFLFAMFDEAEELRILLSWRGLEVQNIWKTRIPGILSVLFRTRELAKQVFTQQKEIGVRFVPHDTTSKYWHKGPSPKFHVIYETTRRLTVKSGKSFANKTVGDFLMKNSRMDRGCMIWADQMKGYRLRVVGFVGKFVSKDGRVTVRDEPPSASEREAIGWVSTQCNITKTKFVIRLNGKQIKNYLCSRALE